ncbi:MAG: alcohol dehydrogenase catalytic domain-containing protein [Deltaproteobacteria bacterium]|nr:alcohol dehydrogenase catalytic domain-containing protein [Deltaproteobacteria bacterium]
MKSVTLTDLKTLEIKLISKPVIRKPGDVLLKISAVGICGSDIHYFEKGKIGNQIVQYPFTIGHECTAVVAEVGNQVTDLSPGTLVAVEPNIYCGHCSQCLIGRHHTCLNSTFLGCPGQAEGCLVEYLIMPQECCIPLGKGIKPIEGALIEPLSIGAYAVQLGGNLEEKKIGILGSGPIGLSILQALKKFQPATIYVTDKRGYRLKAARTLGSNWQGNPESIDIVKKIVEEEPDLLDVVFECCGDSEALDQAVDLLKPGGKLLLVGIPETNHVSFNINSLRRKEICIQNVRRQNDCIHEAIKILKANPIFAETMVTHHFTMANTAEAFELVSKYQDGVIKAVITF